MHSHRAVLVVAVAAVVCTCAAGAAASSHSDELRWLTFGDWGATSSNAKHQADVAQAMDDHAKSWEPDVLITTGYASPDAAATHPPATVPPKSAHSLAVDPCDGGAVLCGNAARDNFYNVRGRCVCHAW